MRVVLSTATLILMTASISIGTTDVIAASAIAYCRLKDSPGVAIVNKSYDILSARNEAQVICWQDVRKRQREGAEILNSSACCGIKVFSTDDSKCIALAENRQGNYRIGEGRNAKEAAGEAVLRCGGNCTIPVRSYECGER